MAKRFIFKVFIGFILFIANAAKDFTPIGKMYIRVRACELNIDQLLKYKLLSEIESIISEEELDEFKRLKINYCKFNFLKYQNK